MRILAINYEYTLTGSTLILLRLAEHLREVGHEVSVCAAVPHDGPIKDSYRNRGFTVLEPPFPISTDVAICNTVLTAPQLLETAGSAKTVWWLHEGSLGLTHLLRNPNQIAAFAQASAVVFPIAHQRDWNSALALRRGLVRWTLGAATAPRCLHKRPTLVASAQASASNVPS